MHGDGMDVMQKERIYRIAGFTFKKKRKKE